MKTLNRSFQRGWRVGAGLLALWGTAFATARMVQAQDEASAPKQQGGVPAFMGGSQILEALKKSPGCLGVEAAQTLSGKKVIFAWFENKKAAMAWYSGAAHQQMMKMLPTPPRAPLTGVKDDKIPILVIASLKQNKEPDPVTKMPFSQISVELYTTVEGGFAYKGRFAPDSLKVKGMGFAQ